MNHIIAFDSVPWLEAAVGLRTREVRSGNARVRLAEFSAGFVEAEWCKNGHIGYVLEGEFAIDYSGEWERYKKGDTFLIPKGEADKHKAMLREGEKVTLLLFEVAEA